ncbi:MAG: glycosyltransferase [Ruminococcus flavefaciens]|nr:glycosyltransferase [Ruminococcus flavefaciens]
MNIAFDAVAILGYMSRNRGIGNYALNQFTGMVNQDKENRYFFLNLIDRDFKLSPMITNDNFTEDFIDTGRKNVLLRNETYSDVIGGIIKRYIRENHIDIFYITSPFESGFTMYKKEWFEGVRVISTVYDIIPYVMKEKYLADKNTYNWYMKCIENLWWSDELFVISESVKTDLVKYLNFSPDNIKTIWGGVDGRYRIIDISDSEKSLLMDKFGITRPFIMCTGGEDGRKNLDGLIRAYSLMPENIKNSYQLVVVCKLSENGMKKLKDIARSHNVEKDVIFTNFVSDEELLKFYNLATLMAFPSKYEGFGLPIVEAWACGTPVLTADNSSLKEIAGDSAVLVNADIDQSIADGMTKMLNSKEILSEYAEKGKKRVDLFNWKLINDHIIYLINDMPSKKTSLSKPERLKIAFFTPLPPLESGIADYSEDIINELCKYCDIDVFVEETYNAKSVFPANVSMYSHRSYPARQEKYADTIFQIGNSEYHLYMYQYIRKYHGTVVLHDYNLHGAFYHYAITLRKGNYELYKTFIDTDRSDADSYIQALQNGSANPDLYGTELNSYITDSADRIIVHSQYARKKLLEKNIACNVTVIPLYAEILPVAENRTVKQKNNFSDSTTIISALGGIHRTKRIIPILKAFSRLSKENSNVHLMLVGKPSDDIKQELEQVIVSENLKEKVTITGYTDIEKFKEYIDMSDICLNLRYPYNGETSGSLMRILAKKRCVIVNDIGSFSEIPDNACVKIPSVENMGETREPEEIYKVLKRLCDNSNERSQTAEYAREYAENVLDIKLVAKKYYNVISAEKNKPIVTENIIQSLKSDINITAGDIKGLAQTLSYAKNT